MNGKIIPEMSKRNFLALRWIVILFQFTHERDLRLKQIRRPVLSLHCEIILAKKAKLLLNMVAISNFQYCPLQINVPYDRNDHSFSFNQNDFTSGGNKLPDIF